jgi:ribosomal-protein-alanine acetyltransferase
MGEIVYRSAGRADLDRLIALAENCPGAPRWTSATWHQVMDSVVEGEQRNILVAESEDGLIGFGVVGIAGEQAEIESVAVSVAARRQGIGRNLCEALIEWARMGGANGVLLEVRVSNHTARALYGSLGFREVAVRRGYYREPDEDGLTMASALSKGSLLA